MTEAISPFVPGTRVAIEVDGGFRGQMGYHEAFVEKVHKSGRFTLRGSPQQWRPDKPWSSRNYWSASQTGGNSWSRSPQLRIWDGPADAEVRDAIAKAIRYQKFLKLKRDVEGVAFNDLVTDEALDQFQIVILAIKPIPMESAS